MPAAGHARGVADRRTTEPSPPDEPGGPLEWWRELIDEPERGVAPEVEPHTPDEPGR
jgi:hypothetical protein